MAFIIFKKEHESQKRIKSLTFHFNNDPSNYTFGFSQYLKYELFLLIRTIVV